MELDAGSGFCFGVVYAIELAEELLAERGYLYCLGDIVHNDEEVLRLQRQGLRIIDYESCTARRNRAAAGPRRAAEHVPARARK
jgi:4-hydroxy-3-methylbut-2-enyl diphosphate reductase